MPMQDGTVVHTVCDESNWAELFGVMHLRPLACISLTPGTGETVELDLQQGETGLPALFLSGEGELTALKARALASALLEAARQLDAGNWR